MLEDPADSWPGHFRLPQHLSVEQCGQALPNRAVGVLEGMTSCLHGLSLYREAGYQRRQMLGPQPL